MRSYFFVASKIAVASSFLTVLFAGPANAVVLSDLNSSVGIDEASQGGLSSWSVDGTDQLFQQWFWYRVGNTGPESSIDTLTLNNTTLYGNRGVSLEYSGSGFDMTVDFILTGGTAGSGVSDLAENIRIVNTSGSNLDFSFFQYSDFDLGGAGGDTVEQSNANTVRQWDGVVSLQEETVGTPAPSHIELANFAQTLNSLNDTFTTTLDDTSGPISGDVTWAWQWDLNIASGGSALISKDMQLSVSAVPVPAAVWLFGSGLLGLVGVGRRKKAAW